MRLKDGFPITNACPRRSHSGVGNDGGGGGDNGDGGGGDDSGDDAAGCLDAGFGLVVFANNLR